MSCTRDLQPYTTFFGLIINPKHRVPEDIECCSSCWHRMSVRERIETVIQVRDRQMGGAVQLVASMVESALLDRRG